jgi:hypothetical protein
MKYIYTLLFVCVSAFAYSQCQITLQPGPNEAKDARLFNLPPGSSFAQQFGIDNTTNIGDVEYVIVDNWTYQGTLGPSKSLLEFDLDSLANAGCTVSEAILVFTTDGNSSHYHCGSGSTIVPCIDNSFMISRVTEAWDEMTVTASTEPNSTAAVPGQDFVVVGNESQPYVNYEIDITDMVNYWLANPSENYGMLMSPQASQAYERFMAASSDHPDAWRRPKLEMTMMCQNSCTNTISGVVFDDISGDCIQDTGEDGLENWLVKIEPGPFYASTDANGYYEANVGDGVYTVTQLIPNNFLWDSVCPIPYNHIVDLSSGGDAPNTDFSVNADNYCAQLTVDIGASFLRPCHTELFYVQYCNDGNVDETDVSIDIELDDQLTVSSSTMPWQSVNGNTYTFWVGDLAAGECGMFSMEVVVDCAANVGDVECVTASIFPPNLCEEPDPVWDKSSVMVEGGCEDDSLACFTITNTGDFGEGDMDTPSEYRIYENGVLVYVGSFQLVGQDDTIICWPAYGSAIQLQADQNPGHPGNSEPNDWVEGCGFGGGSGCGQAPCVLTTPQNDADPYTEIECLEVIASYDPNDKTPTPFGIDEEQFIGADDLIEYKIRFQNTGNDTAFVVILKDKIDTDVLDIATVQSGVSSHPYSFEVTGEGILQWTFDPIALVDSATNEAASIGFVKFKIAQQPGNQPGTLIENFVDIYFDNNAPVRTDTAYNTIEFPGKPNVGLPYLHNEAIELIVYPNPANDILNFELSEAPQASYVIQLRDTQGRLVKTTGFNGLTSMLEINDITDGIYIYQIVSENTPLASGKVVVRH